MLNILSYPAVLVLKEEWGSDVGAITGDYMGSL